MNVRIFFINFMLLFVLKFIYYIIFLFLVKIIVWVWFMVKVKGGILFELKVIKKWKLFINDVKKE